MKYARKKFGDSLDLVWFLNSQHIPVTDIIHIEYLTSYDIWILIYKA